MLQWLLRNPENETVLIEGVLFRARYLGSTQLISEGQPSKGHEDDAGPGGRRENQGTVKYIF